VPFDKIVAGVCATRSSRLVKNAIYEGTLAMLGIDMGEMEKARASSSARRSKRPT
jgi:hypothetical protein